MTEEEITKSVSAAYDSVHLIDELRAKTGSPALTEEEIERLDRNIAHLRIMMAKDWFFAALTSEQKTQIQAYIA